LQHRRSDEGPPIADQGLAPNDGPPAKTGTDDRMNPQAVPDEFMSIAKTAARVLLPDSIFQKLKAVRSRQAQLRGYRRLGLLEAAARYVERNGCIVRHGPFAGLQFPRVTALNRHSIPLLMGTCEMELWPVLEQVARRNYDVVLNIGSGEGYYAVGLARLLNTRVLAYDPEPREQEFCRAAAQLSGVAALVDQRNLFLRADIEEFREMRVLCVSDCEGFEAELFTPETVRGLRRWDLIIELHGEADRKLRALNWPQKVTAIDSTPRLETYPELDGLGDPKLLLSELRGGRQTWLWCDSQ